MDYITVKELAAKWCIAERSIQNYCANGKIPGAKRIGGQWLIPLDAKFPLDKRTKLAKACGSIENYRFPVFIYSKYYRDPSELTPNEQSLLKAQILHYEGDHIQSLAICNELLDEKLPSYLRAGVYLIAGIDAFLLGLVSRYEEAMSRLEKLVANEAEHKEDFRLIKAALKFYIDWNSSGILEIQPSKLSPGAVWYYQTMILALTALTGAAMPIFYLRFWESECPYFEKEGMTPMLYYFYCGLGVLNDHDRLQEERDAFLKRGVELAIENNWIPNLTRFYNFSPGSLDKIIKDLGAGYYRDFVKAYKSVMDNWGILHLRETGLDLANKFTARQCELLLLVAKGYTDKEITVCLGLSKDSTSRKIKELMKISKTASKAELRAYARHFYDTSFDLYFQTHNEIIKSRR